MPDLFGKTILSVTNSQAIGMRPDSTHVTVPVQIIEFTDGSSHFTVLDPQTLTFDKTDVTTITERPVVDYGDQVVLENWSAVWEGTFGVLVTTLLNDIMSDGEPTQMMIVTDDNTVNENGVNTYTRYVGQVCAYDEDEHTITFTDGTKTSSRSIVGIYL